VVDDTALSRESEAATQVQPGGRGSGDSVPGRGDFLLDGRDACQVAFVFIATQFIADRAADLLATTAGWPGSNSFTLLAGQLAATALPIACLFRLRPRALQMLRSPGPGPAELLVVVLLSLPVVCLLEFVSPLGPLTCGLPPLAAASPSSYDTALGLAVMCVIGPAVEEVCFRGLIGPDLVLRYGTFRGTMAGAGLFAATRLGSSELGAAFLLGLACHVAYLGTDSIAAPIVLHGLTNFFGRSFDRVGVDLPLALSALLAVAVLGYAVFAGHWRRSDGRRPAGPAVHRIAIDCVVLLIALPFYLLLLYRLRPIVGQSLELFGL
jgi:membrane protease YdiL (CAAX protease family)